MSNKLVLRTFGKKVGSTVDRLRRSLNKSFSIDISLVLDDAVSLSARDAISTTWWREQKGTTTNGGDLGPDSQKDTINFILKLL